MKLILNQPSSIDKSARITAFVKKKNPDINVEYLLMHSCKTRDVLLFTGFKKIQNIQ